MSNSYTKEEIEQLRMKARLLDAVMRYGGLNSEQLKEYNEVLGALRDLKIQPWNN